MSSTITITENSGDNSVSWDEMCGKLGLYAPTTPPGSADRLWVFHVCNLPVLVGPTRGLASKDYWSQYRFRRINEATMVVEFGKDDE